jgi:hypothetical protein
MTDQFGQHTGGLNTARYGLAGAGTQTAGLGFGGYTTANTGATEEYDGSTWTASAGSLNTVRHYLGAAGTQTAALAFGGVLQVHLLQEQQKNITEQLGHLIYWFKYSKKIISRLLELKQLV